MLLFSQEWIRSSLNIFQSLKRREHNWRNSRKDYKLKSWWDLRKVFIEWQKVATWFKTARKIPHIKMSKKKKINHKWRETMSHIYQATNKNTLTILRNSKQDRKMNCKKTLTPSMLTTSGNKKFGRRKKRSWEIKRRDMKTTMVTVRMKTSRQMRRWLKTMRQSKLLISRTTSKLETSIWCGKIQMKMNLRRLNKTSDGMRKKQGKMCKLMMKGKRSMPPSQNTLNSWSKTMKVWKRIRLSRWWRTTMS